MFGLPKRSIDYYTPIVAHKVCSDPSLPLVLLLDEEAHDGSVCGRERGQRLDRVRSAYKTMAPFGCADKPAEKYC
jgi:hypothetical protein